MAWTTDAAVRAVIEVDVSIVDLTPFIDIAAELVTERCVPSGYTDQRLEMIERLLAAHFVCLREFRDRSTKAGSVGQVTDTKLDLFLSHTHHGQMAQIMDTAGGLAALQEEIEEGGPTPVGISWLGEELD